MQDVAVKCLYRFDGAGYIDAQGREHPQREHQHKNDRIYGEVPPLLFFDQARQIDGGDTGKAYQDQQEVHAFTSPVLFGFRRHAASRDTAGSASSKVSEKNGAAVAPQSMFSITDSKTRSA